MNKLVILITLAFLTSYNSTAQRNNSVPKNNGKMEPFGKQLIEAGFLKYVNPKTTDRVSEVFIKDLDIYDSILYRYVHIDAEELAEGSLDFFMPELLQMISKRGVNISIKKADDFESSNSVFIEQKEIKLYEKENIDDYSLWDVAPNRFFFELNKLMEKQNIEDRFYLLYGGNDLGVLFITPSQFNIIKRMYSNSPKDVPFEPKK